MLEAISIERLDENTQKITKLLATAQIAALETYL